MTIRTIAVVDDDESVRTATTSLLRSIGFGCRAYSGGEALLEAGLAGIACVCSDVQMPGMSGLELAAILQSTPAAPPVILMTAYPDARIVNTAATTPGIGALLEKPLDADLLVAAIEAAIGGAGDMAR